MKPIARYQHLVAREAVMTESEATQRNGGEEKEPKKRRKDPRAGEAWGAALTRDTSIYVIGAVIGFLLALISIAVVTRFLAVAQFGQLALLLTFRRPS